MDIYSLETVIPLSYARVRNNALVSGLTVTVVVKNALTAATILSSTSVPEISSSGIYTFNWTHGQTADVECLATYTVGSATYQEYFLISNDATGGRAT